MGAADEEAEGHSAADAAEMAADAVDSVAKARAGSNEARPRENEGVGETELGRLTS
jgi:hypothetical protein